jgi:hypothetical protein
MMKKLIKNIFYLYIDFKSLKTILVLSKITKNKPKLIIK